MADQGMKSVQQNNFSETLRVFYEHTGLSKNEIAELLGNSLPTVTANLTTLLDQGLIKKAGSYGGQRGRRAVRYTLNPQAFASIGLEIFGSNISLVLVGADFEVADQVTWEIPFENTLRYFDQVSKKIQAFIDDSIYQADQIVGMGVGVQGLVSADGAEVLYGKILNMTGLHTDVFTRYFKFPVYYVHDADAVAIAEQQIAHRSNDAIYMSIGEHLGTAMVVDGQIYHGAFGNSGTMEHITINSKNGRKCYCGRRGCLETYASISALLHERDETLPEFMSLVSSGDVSATKRWDSYLEHLAYAINNLQMFADNTIVLAGELAPYLSDVTVEQLGAQISKITAFPEIPSKIEIGQAKQHAVATGAAIPALQNYLNQI
ncbi:putative NBD/HSP70 family sugar kinase [Weissella uvarum]|uniref:ROK family transcriptional regulator n=1 Tax=Weissella uvarum TaxID=1479233 RepID=UPI00196171B7|nr:ROK family transcriptional regulator [Weissella uvarum]MBM7616712.1 putative NBD/HSP70 family sugar kinase [Weissella uvarum]MCM0594833.1 ROK family transcriptional regulator [Weissella uvarum]